MKSISQSDIVNFLKNEVSKECGIPIHEISTELPFVEFRMDSLKAVYIMDRLEKYIGEELSPLYFWDHPTIASLSEFLSREVLKQ